MGCAPSNASSVLCSNTEQADELAVKLEVQMLQKLLDEKEAELRVANKAYKNVSELKCPTRFGENAEADTEIQAPPS
jgi:hypothetical protein